MLLGEILYFLALSIQLLAVFYALNLYLHSKSYRLASSFLLISLVLMVCSRVVHTLDEYKEDYIDYTDLGFSILISVFIFLSLMEYRKILLDLEVRNFTLDHSVKFDSLTSTLSRAETFSRVKIEIMKSFRNKHFIAFLMADIDHFKDVNDQYGHPLGDLVLINLAKHCQEELREVDIFGRVGGEEFLIVLPESNLSQAQEVAERLRLAVSAKPCAFHNGHPVSITISLGISVFDPTMEKDLLPAALLKKYYELCDQAMYRAKASGRNKVCF
jgi:diguanylate cyclase (GGDEF)-like protein